MKTSCLCLLLCAPLIASAAAAETRSDIAATRERPPFFAAETPFQMLGMAATGAAGGMIGALILGGILSSRESKACREQQGEPDGDSWEGCGLSGLGGLIQGTLIGFPIGHALGAGLAGRIQGKHGVVLTMVSAVAGDFALGLLAFQLHDRFDGKWLDNGESDPWLIYGTIIGGMSIPIATQTIYDYRIRFPMRSRIAFGPGGETRMRMELVQIGF